MISNFSNYNESRLSDIHSMKSEEISDAFTISLEIEMETEDENAKGKPYTDSQIIKIIGLIRKKMIGIIKTWDFGNDKESILKFLDKILEDVTVLIDDDDTSEIDDILDPKNYTKYERSVIEALSPIAESYFDDNFIYLENKLKENFSAFWTKWGRKLKYEIDNTLNRGIEFSFKTYLKGVNQSIEFIKDFYTDYNLQKYWKFTTFTGIHINIGLNYKSKFNPIKGLVILDDESNSSFTFRNMESRSDNAFCLSLKKAILDIPKEKKEELFEKINLKDISSAESILNAFLFEFLRKRNPKSFGFNLDRLKVSNYVEFRYPGDNISQDVLIDKLLYFCYIVYCMTNPDYKRNDYYKKLYSFVQKLK